MPTSRRKVAKQTEAEFRDKVREESFPHSAVEGSLDKMAGSSQEIAPGGKVRKKLQKSAKSLTRSR